MPLCGSSKFCGCSIVSTPAASGAIDGELPTIDVAGAGFGPSPWNLTLNDGWAIPVGGFIDGFGEEGTYTPALTNIAIGGDVGSPSNLGRYRFFGGPAVGDEGLLYLEGEIVLGDSGSVTGAISIGIPSGFQFASTHRPRMFTGRTTAGAGNYIVNLVIGSATTITVNALRASGTYLDSVATSATIPGTWATGNHLNWGGVWPAVRV